MTWHQALPDGHADPCGRCGRVIRGHQPYARVSSGRLVRCVACVAEQFGEQPPVELEPVEQLPPLPFAPVGALADDWKARQSGERE